MKKLLLLLLIPCVVHAAPTCTPAPTNTQCTAADASYTEVNAAVQAVAEGGTVIVPQGDVTWTQMLTISKSLTIRGATTITNVGDTSTPKRPPVVTDHCNDLTRITDNAPLTGNLIKVNVTSAHPTPAPSGPHVRISGLTVYQKLGIQGHGSGCVNLTNNPGPAYIRIDNCHFAVRGVVVQVTGWTYGVMDHCFLNGAPVEPPPINNSWQSFQFQQDPYGNGTNTAGNGSFADPPFYGSEKFFFFEASTIFGSGNSLGSSDGKSGGRFVARHCYWYNTRPGFHGTEGNLRGMRAGEVYNNILDYDTTTAYSAENRSGSVIYHDNKWIGRVNGSNNHSVLTIFRAKSRAENGTLGGAADGTGPFDMNVTESDGTTFIEGNAPKLFFSGTATGPTNPSTGCTANNVDGGYVVDNTKNFNSVPGFVGRDWTGYSVKNVGPQLQDDSCMSFWSGGIITSFTATQLNFSWYSPTDRGPAVSFRPTEGYEVHKCLAAMDGPGVGKGDLLFGGSGSDSQALTIRKGQTGDVNHEQVRVNFGVAPPTVVPSDGNTFPHFQFEPCMSWNNVGPAPNNVVQNFGNSDAMTLGSNGPSGTGRNYRNLGAGLTTNGAPTQMTNLYKATCPSGQGNPITCVVNGNDYSGTYTYPHPFSVTGPQILDTSTTFSIDKPGGNSFTVKTSGFTGSPITWDAPTGTMPTAVFFNTTTGTFSGSAHGATPGQYSLTLTAHTTVPETATGPFVITIQSPNLPPQFNTPPFTSPTDGQNFKLSDIVAISPDVTDDTGLTSVVIKADGSTLTTITTPPFTYNWSNTSTPVPLTSGSHAITAVADDGFNTPVTSSAVNITVATTTPTPSPAKISIRP